MESVSGNMSALSAGRDALASRLCKAALEYPRLHAWLPVEQGAIFSVLSLSSDLDRSHGGGDVCRRAVVSRIEQSFRTTRTISRTIAMRTAGRCYRPCCYPSDRMSHIHWYLDTHPLFHRLIKEPLLKCWSSCQWNTAHATPGHSPPGVNSLEYMGRVRYQ